MESDRLFLSSETKAAASPFLSCWSITHALTDTEPSSGGLPALGTQAAGCILHALTTWGAPNSKGKGSWALLKVKSSGSGDLYLLDKNVFYFLLIVEKVILFLTRI